MEIPLWLEPVDGFTRLPVDPITVALILLLTVGVFLWLVFRHRTR